jgi:hypothetical protein
MQLCGLVEGRSGPSFRAWSALRGSRPPDRRARGVATPRARFHYARLRPTGGDPGLPPCGGRRHGGLRPGGRERRRADRGVVASGHRSFLWRPTWIPAFAGMTVFLLCGHGRRWSRTAAVVVGRCGGGRRRWWTTAVAVAVGRYGHDRRRCRPWRGDGHVRSFPQNPAVMSDTAPARLRTPPPPSSPRKATVSPHAGRVGGAHGISFAIMMLIVIAIFRIRAVSATLPGFPLRTRPS